MQYNREEDGSLTPLPKKNIDTGLGLERIASVLQKADTDFETDLFLPIIEFVAQNAGIKYKEDQKKDLALKVIADHIRALVFMISDSIEPSNEGRGYVLRMLLRRAFRYGKVIHYNQPFLFEVAPVVIDLMKEVYPEIYKEENRICQVILTEEKRFQETLNIGIQILDNLKVELKHKNTDMLSGKEVSCDFSLSIFIILNSYSLSLFNFSLGCPILSQSISDTGTNPSIPFSNLINAPKSLTLITLPFTTASIL